MLDHDGNAIPEFQNAVAKPAMSHTFQAPRGRSSATFEIHACHTKLTALPSHSIQIRHLDPLSVTLALPPSSLCLKSQPPQLAPPPP
jgi:hypothetical protein